jgi:hypothetical protein
MRKDGTLSIPRIEKILRRSEEFQKQLPERLKQLEAGSRTETIRGWAMMGGFGHWLDPREAYGSHEYSWQEHSAHVRHKFALLAGHEMDIVERRQMTEDDKTLVFEQEIYCGGRKVKRAEFSVAQSAGPN